MTPIQPNEITTPHLNFIERQALLLSLNSAMFGLGEVTVGFVYDKQTKTKPRIAGKDYVSLPGTDTKAQFGQIVMVARRQKDGGVYFKVASMTRGNGQSPRGYTNVRPEGIRQFTITGFQPAQQVSNQQ
jgi:hypothetical protein